MHAIHFLLIHVPPHRPSYPPADRLMWNEFPCRISHSSFLGSSPASAKTFCSGLQGWKFGELLLQLQHSPVNVICAIASKRPRAFCHPDSARSQGLPWPKLILTSFSCDSRCQLHARAIPEVLVHKRNPQWSKCGHYRSERVGACKKTMLRKYIKVSPPLLSDSSTPRSQDNSLGTPNSSM